MAFKIAMMRALRLPLHGASPSRLGVHLQAADQTADFFIEIIKENIRQQSVSCRPRWQPELYRESLTKPANVTLRRSNQPRRKQLM